MVNNIVWGKRLRDVKEIAKTLYGPGREALICKVCVSHACTSKKSFNWSQILNGVHCLMCTIAS
jgi:hypothetical protein